METTPADLESWTSSNLAPEESPASLIVLERSTCLLLCLVELLDVDVGDCGFARTHLRPYWVGERFSFVHASSKTSLNGFVGVVLIVARRRLESITTTWEAIFDSWQGWGQDEVGLG